MKTGAGIGALLAATVLLLSCGPIQPTAGNQPSCEDVRYQCAFDSACSEGLKSYFLMCDKLLQADTTKCPETCLFALVALTTTYHGQRLLDCACRDSFCEMIKTRVEVCRPLVIEATRNETVVPCEMARWVCHLNPQCSMAYHFYESYCKRMLLGQTCSERCLNSWEILHRQDKAVMMNKCRCMGRSATECLRHKERMVRLCFGGADDKSGGGRKNRKKHRPKAFEDDPDRDEVELMLADADYQPDVRNRYNVTGIGIGQQQPDRGNDVVGDNDSADAADAAAAAAVKGRVPWPATLMCAATAAVAVALL